MIVYGHPPECRVTLSRVYVIIRNIQKKNMLRHCISVGEASTGITEAAPNC